MPEGHEERQADLCCGFCCDLRRACIVCNICDIFLTTLLICMSVSGVNQTFVSTVDFNVFATSDYDYLDDDETKAEMEAMKTQVLIVVILLGLGVIFAGIGIYGALKFNRYMVLLTAVWLCIDVIRSAITLMWVNTVVAACFAYPHFALFWALKKQQITPENYQKSESHCCCDCCIGVN